MALYFMSFNRPLAELHMARRGEALFTARTGIRGVQFVLVLYKPGVNCTDDCMAIEGDEGCTKPFSIKSVDDATAHVQHTCATYPRGGGDRTPLRKDTRLMTVVCCIIEYGKHVFTVQHTPRRHRASPSVARRRGTCPLREMAAP